MAILYRRLLTDKGTLYGQTPTAIAHRTEQRLNQLQEEGLEIVSIAAVPDFHNFGADGGVKDILFTCVSSAGQNLRWVVNPLIIEDDKTMHGKQMVSILESLEMMTRALETGGCQIRHLIMLTDHHGTAHSSGVGGYDGLKNILICYQI